MAYIKINDHDYSMYCNALKINRSTAYRSQTNAAGNTTVDKTIPKREIEVGIIPLSDDVMSQLLDDIYEFKVAVSFLNPNTKQLEEGVICIIPDSEVEYYTIQTGKIQYKALNLTFTEL